MVYRIHFTLEDLARTRVAEPPPLLELSAALRTLRERGHPVRFERGGTPSVTPWTPARAWSSNSFRPAAGHPHS